MYEGRGRSVCVTDCHRALPVCASLADEEGAAAAAIGRNSSTLTALTDSLLAPGPENVALKINCLPGIGSAHGVSYLRIAGYQPISPLQALLRETAAHIVAEVCKDEKLRDPVTDTDGLIAAALTLLNGESTGMRSCASFVCPPTYAWSCHCEHRMLFAAFRREATSTSSHRKRVL
jgi:hypothetical protein